jgi:predicted GNAT superfamily acetyltransferase
MVLPPPGYALRHAREDDHAAIVDAIGRWWDTPNRAMLGLLFPRLFVQFFTRTSWVLEDESGQLGAFLVAFRSQDDPAVAYIHFVGVDPSLRGSGVGRGLYELAFDTMRDLGCTEIRAITGPFNRRSQAFHAAMGFAAHGDELIEGVLAYADYDGPGEARVTFRRAL